MKKTHTFKVPNKGRHALKKFFLVVGSLREIKKNTFLIIQK